MKKTVLSCLLFSAAMLLGSAEFARIQNFAIVLPDKPTEIEKSAAAELKEHLSRSFTAPAKLNGQTPAAINLFVGLSEQAKKSGFAGDYSSAAQENKFGIYRNNNDFLLLGYDSINGNIYTFKDSCGTFLAVVYFAQKYLQTKFFLPGKNGVKYAVNPAITFSANSDIPNASYAVRGFQTAAKDISSKDFMLFYRRRLGQVPLWSIRNYYYAFLNKWNKRFKDKPEMFSLFGNKRINAKYPRHFPCPSHPDTVKQIIADIDAAIKKDPKINSIRFFCDAPVKNCECDKCVKSPVGKLVTADDRSEFVFAFFCKFANELKKKYPGMIFHLQTKSSHFQPPRTEKLPADTVIAVLSGQFVAPDYKMLRDRCNQWKDAGAKVVLYCYPRVPEMRGLPIMNPHRIADHFKAMEGFALGATMSEGRANLPYTFSALNTYVHSATMFDCSLDTDKLITEFCELVSPKAAKELEAYYNSMEKLLEGAGFRDNPMTNCYLTFRLKTPRQLLDKAVAKDPDNAFLQALSKDISVFEETSRKAAVGITSEKEYNDLLKLIASRQEPIKLSNKESVINFKPFAVFNDFQPTQVKVSQQNDKLKLQFICSENKISKLRLKTTANHTGNVWLDDSVEIFLAPYGKATPRIQVGLNALGVYQVIFTGNDNNSCNTRDFAITTHAKRERGRWVLDVEIPMSEVKKFAEQNKFGLGLYRHRPTRTKINAQAQNSGAQKPTSGSFNSVSGRFPVEF